MEDLSHSTSTLSNKEVVINGDDEVDEKVVKVKTSVSLLQEMCVAFKLGTYYNAALIYQFMLLSYLLI